MFSQRSENTPDLKCRFSEQDGTQYRANADHNHQLNMPSNFVPFALFKMCIECEKVSGAEYC